MDYLGLGTHQLGLLARLTPEADIFVAKVVDSSNFTKDTLKSIRMVCEIDINNTCTADY
jgi:hypothetical protein